MEKILMVALGGSIGAVLRYLVSAGIHSIGAPTFPFGTLAVNLLGCLAIGFLGTAFTGPILIREELRIALLIGLLGSFTTFSTFGWETLKLLGDGQYIPAISNIVLNNVLGIAAVLIGCRWAQRAYGM